jgi:8-oxo-dGTP pyrophosphatase MutT (NUDIX family)
MARSPDQVHREVCVVLYRIREQRIEFCLVSTDRSSRWEFPHSECVANQAPLDVARRCVLEQAGMTCRESTSEALDDVMATQDRQIVQLVAYLLEVEDPESTTPSRRIRWCFAEEARARIRRKPMRRLIDLGLRRLADQAEQ